MAIATTARGALPYLRWHRQTRQKQAQLQQQKTEVDFGHLGVGFEAAEHR